MAPPQSAVANSALLSSGSVHYLDTVSGAPSVVLLHAGSGNASLWDAQIRALSTRGFRVVAYDRDNHGRSRRNPGVVTSSSTELDELLQALKLSHVHLVGVAAGGGVALRYAINHPERVLSLTIANSLGDVEDAAYQQLGERLRPKEFYELPLELRELGPSYRAAHPDGVARWLALSRSPALPSPTQTRPAPDSPHPPALPVRENLGKAELPAPTRALSAPEPPRRSELPVTFANLAGLRCPVFFLTGDADLYTPPAVLELFHQHLPHACVQVIRDTGHASFWENPEQFNDALLWFLTTQPVGSACQSK